MNPSKAGNASEGLLHEKLIEQLQAVHAIKAAALRMLSVTLAAVRKQCEQDPLPGVGDLLEKMTSTFAGHEQETRVHERELRSRLEALGAGRSKPKQFALEAAALLRGNLARIGGPNHGANARDAFVFEHLEIASYELLEELARRARDPATAELASRHREQDEEVAGTIRRNFDNVLSLMLASEGIPPARSNGERAASNDRVAGNDEPNPAA